MFTEHLPSDQPVLCTVLVITVSLTVPERKACSSFTVKWPPWPLRGRIKPEMSISNPVASQKTHLPQLCSPQTPGPLEPHLRQGAVTVPALLACPTPREPGDQAQGCPEESGAMGSCSVPEGAVSPSPGLTLGPSFFPQGIC